MAGAGVGGQDACVLKSSHRATKPHRRLVRCMNTTPRSRTTTCGGRCRRIGQKIRQNKDRERWNRDHQAECQALLETALRRKRAGPLQIKAAIGACQMADPAPERPQILQLYTALMTLAENGLLAAALASKESVRRFLAGRVARLG